MNIVKNIDEKQLSHYENMGFSCVDGKGNVIVKKDNKSADKTAALEKELAEVKKAIAEKDKKIAELEEAAKK